MKTKIKKVVAIMLCFSVVFSMVSMVSAFAEENEFVIEESAENSKGSVKNIFDRMANLMIGVVHEIIVSFRFPWKATKNELDLSKFELTFEDEFEGETLDESVWWSFGNGIRKGGYWDREQAFVDDGCLKIRTEYKEDGVYGPGYYSWRACTRGRFEQTYGYFECRCILPAAQGLWSAFWLTNTAVQKEQSAKDGTEIDVFESPLWVRGKYGLENNLVTSNLHYGGYSLGHRYSNVAVAKANNPYEEFNTYGVEWNENEYIFYVNGKETGRSSFGGVSENPQYMMLTVEVDGVGGVPSKGWSGLITKNKEGALPADFIVDYVRVYQYK